MLHDGEDLFVTPQASQSQLYQRRLASVKQPRCATYKLPTLDGSASSAEPSSSARLQNVSRINIVSRNALVTGDGLGRRRCVDTSQMSITSRLLVSLHGGSTVGYLARHLAKAAERVKIPGLRDLESCITAKCKSHVSDPILGILEQYTILVCYKSKILFRNDTCPERPTSSSLDKQVIQRRP